LNSGRAGGFKARHAALILTALVIAGAVSVAALNREVKAERDFFKMGTVVRITAGARSEAECLRLIDAAAAEADRLESLLSANLKGSDIYRVNENAGSETEVSEESFELMKRALHWSVLTGGAFDPAIGSVVRLWGIGTDRQRVPEDSEIESAGALCSADSLKLSSSDGRFFASVRNGCAADLGGIAKGYAADKITELLADMGAKSVLLDLGGNIALYSASSRKSWRIGIQWPFKPRGVYMGVLTSRGGTVVTSGPYERFFERDGVLYHHIFDPKTGRPAESDLLSVTVSARNSADADALSTSLYVMGFERAREFLTAHGEVDAVLCKGSPESPEIFVTRGLEDSFKPSDSLKVKPLSGGAGN
jgi:thiamine biosynthesis lipoprotein